MERETEELELTQRVSKNTQKKHRVTDPHDHQLQARDSDAPPLPVLPHEIIIEILSRLPVKSLIRFRCVCKTWKTLFSDSHFVKKHLKTSKTVPKLIINDSSDEFSVKSCTLESIYNDPFSDAIELHYPCNHNSCLDWIVGSCNGLLCVAIKQDTVLLWNPSTRVVKQLPGSGFIEKRGSFSVYGFGFDSVSDDYKVVGVFCCRGRNGYGYEKNVKVWSMRSNSWRRVEDFPLGVPLDVSGKCVDGTLNWVLDCSKELGSSWIIVSIDLAKETYKEVLQPVYEDVGFSDRSLGTLGGCLCVKYDYRGVRADFWVMKEYGVRESWTKLISIPYLTDSWWLRYSIPLWVSNDGKVLLEYWSVLVLYDSKDNTFKYPVIRGAHTGYEVDNVYVESLVSPTAEN